MGFDNWRIDERRFLNSVEVKKLRRATRRAKDQALGRGNAVAVRDWFMVELALATGLRVSEMAGLVCGDVLVGHNGYRHVAVRNGKGGKPRLVRVSTGFAEAWQEFSKWKHSRGESTGEDAHFARQTPSCSCTSSD